MFYFLIYLFALTLPFQESTTLGDRGIVFYHIAAFLLYAVLAHSKNLLRMMQTRFFVIVIIFMLCGFLSESFHPYSDYGPIVRMSIMFVGAISIAACLNSRKRVRHVINVFVLTSLVYLIPTLVLGGRHLGGGGIDAFAILNEFFGSTRNPNDIGAILAFLFTFFYIKYVDPDFSKSLLRYPWVYFVFFGIVVALYILDCRLAFVFIIASIFIFLFYFRKMKFGRVGGILITIFVVGVINFDWVQNRFLIYFNEDSKTKFEEVDGRARVYNASFEAIPKVFVAGVGYGNFIGHWGFTSGFVLERHRQGIVTQKVQHAHNTFFQIIINWGLIGIISFLMVLFSLRKRIPSRDSHDPLDYKIFILCLTYFLLLFLSHNLESKEYSLVFAILLSRNILWA